MSECQNVSLNQGGLHMRICEDRANLLLNEKVTISTSDDTSTE